MHRVGLTYDIDLNSFRAALTTLQKQVSDLDQLKAEYYTEVLIHEEETWDAAMEKVCRVPLCQFEVTNDKRSFHVAGCPCHTLILRGLRPDICQVVSLTQLELSRTPC